MNRATILPRRTVRYAPSFGLSRLFRPIPKFAPRSSVKVEYVPNRGKGPKLEFHAWEEPGIPEQTLLLVLVELADEALRADKLACMLDASSDDGVGRHLWKALQICSDADSPERTVRFETTWYELNRRCGYNTSGRSQRQRRQQLMRLCDIIVWEIEQDARQTTTQSHLVAWMRGNSERVHLALNCRLAASLLGERYVQISLAERLTLHTDVAMALHATLSSMVKAGASMELNLDTAVEHVWPGSANNAPPGTHRRRRSALRQALHEIGQLPAWTVEWPRSDKVLVCRRATPRKGTLVHEKKKLKTAPSPRGTPSQQRLADSSADVSGLFASCTGSPTTCSGATLDLECA